MQFFHASKSETGKLRHSPVLSVTQVTNCLLLPEAADTNMDSFL